jgi:hypothetical protein
MPNCSDDLSFNSFRFWCTRPRLSASSPNRRRHRGPRLHPLTLPPASDSRAVRRLKGGARKAINSYRTRFQATVCLYARFAYRGDFPAMLPDKNRTEAIPIRMALEIADSRAFNTAFISAEGGTRTRTPRGATPSRWCVCQFHHFGEVLFLLRRCRGCGRRRRRW